MGGEIERLAQEIAEVKSLLLSFISQQQNAAPIAVLHSKRNAKVYNKAETIALVEKHCPGISQFLSR